MALDNYKTQKSLKEYIKNIINEIGICSSIKNNYSQYYNIFIELFNRHPNPEKMINMCDIQIKSNPLYKHLELHIVYNNGKTDDISYNVCINTKYKNYIKMAMRVSIIPQILEYKNNSIRKCVNCNSNQDLEVDHIIWFEKIYDDFMKNNKIKIPTKFNNTDGHLKCFMSDDIMFEKSWNLYHNANAQLRVLCSNCNKKRDKYKKDSLLN